MKINERFWNAYFGQALRMWESGRAQEILRAIPGRQAQRCIAALHDCTPADRPIVHRLMVARFKSSVCGGLT